MPRIVIKIYILIIWIFLIFTATAVPVIVWGGGGGYLGIDKLAHFLLFGILSFLMLSVWKEFIKNKIVEKNLKNAYKIYLSVGGCCLGCILLSEYLQNFIPGRFPSLGDALAGILGVLSVFLYTLSQKWLFNS